MTVDLNNTFNACSQLVEGDTQVKAFLEEHKDTQTLELVFNKQLQLQTYLEGTKEDWYLPTFNPDVPKNYNETKELIRFCKLHFDREYFELEDSLGGMSRGLKVASSIAKPWKSMHMELLNFKFSDLTEDDKNEVRMEFIDMLHFIAMYGLALGIDMNNLDKYYTNSHDVYKDKRENTNNEDIIDILLGFVPFYRFPGGVTCGKILSDIQNIKFGIDRHHEDIEFVLSLDESFGDIIEIYGLMIIEFLTIGSYLGLTSDDIKYLYTRKNLENFDRQERGY